MKDLIDMFTGYSPKKKNKKIDIKKEQPKEEIIIPNEYTDETSNDTSIE